MLLKDFIKDARASLTGLYPAEEARAIVSRLCSELLGVSAQKHILEPEWEIPSASLDSVEAALSRLEAGEPLQYVLGFAEFCGHRFRVTPAVLIPRPETEELVHLAICASADRAASQPECSATRDSAVGALRVLDLCTGSGCIAWSLAAELPDAEVVAVDISEEALEVAAGQTLEGVKAPRFVKCDVLDPQQLEELGDFDLIVSNPPYVMDREKALMRDNVLEHEPHLALFVPDDDPLRFYRAEADFVTRHLRCGGCGIVEINEALGASTADLFRERGLQKVEILHDFFDRERFVSFEK